MAWWEAAAKSKTETGCGAATRFAPSALTRGLRRCAPTTYFHKRVECPERLRVSGANRGGTEGHLIRYTTKPMSYYFYLARCADGSLYTGSCSDLRARETRHTKGKGAAYTRYRRPVRIVYFEEYPTHLEARRREAQVKPWNRMKKENLAQGKHPTTGAAIHGTLR